MTNCVRRRNNSTRDDVVAIHPENQQLVHGCRRCPRGSSDECGDEADGELPTGWDHQHTKPTDIETVVCRTIPRTKSSQVDAAGAKE